MSASLSDQAFGAGSLIVGGEIIWAAAAIWKRYRWVAVAQAPYFVWMSIATVLQRSVTVTTWGRP